MDSHRYVFKRVKERSIGEALQSVQEWRYLFQNGEIDQKGNKIKYSLKQAAEKVGVPKKTLEDYHQLLKKAQEHIDLDQIRDKKMGFLRNFLKQQQQQQQQQQQISFQEENYLSDQEEQSMKIEQKQEEDDEYNYNVDQMIVDGDIEKQNYIEQEFSYYNYQQDQVMIGMVTTLPIIYNISINPLLKKMNELKLNYNDDDDNDDNDNYSDLDTDDEDDYE